MSTLLARIQANKCAVVDCNEHRDDGSLFCGKHLADMKQGRFIQLADGSFVERRQFRPMDRTGLVRL